MTRIVWDKVGDRTFETGVDRGVLYKPDAQGVYATGVPWNGLVTVTESPSGAEASPQYADNMKYLNLVSAEDFGATVEAFTYPVEFEECDGALSPVAGLSLGQQGRKTFGLSYRTLKGNDTEGTAHGYKIHGVYGALAAPSERAYGTVNESPEPITFSWELSTTAVQVGTINGVNYAPTASFTIDSTEVTPEQLSAIEDILYGTAANPPRLPLPGELIALLSAAPPAAA